MNDYVGDFAIPNTPPNAAMAATVQRRLLADTSYQRAKNACWRMFGFGIFAVLVGIGLGCAAYGYSYVTDQRAAAGNLADALASALRETVLKTEGTVKLEEGGTVKLADGSIVKLDPNATVRFDGGIPRPTEQQLAPNAAPASGTKPVTNFTIFKQVKFDKGDVITGWDYNSSVDTKPHHEYCYYFQVTGQFVASHFTIARDGLPVPRSPEWTFDSVAALTNCTWFNPIVEGRKS